MLMYIGACGWDHPDWLNSYYDKNLPADWRLSFYVRQFKTVLVPHEYWSSLGIEKISEFVNDVAEDYPIIFEVTENFDRLTATPEKSLEKIIKNQLRFKSPSWQCKTNDYLIEQAEIVLNTSLSENIAIFKVSANSILSDNALREVIQTLKTEFSDKDIIYLFFADSLLSIDMLSKAYTLLRFLNLK